MQSPGQNLWKSLGVGLQGIRERKGADREGKTEAVFILNRAKGAEDQGLRRMRASAQLPGPQTMGRDQKSCTLGEGDMRSRDHVTALAKWGTSKSCPRKR